MEIVLTLLQIFGTLSLLVIIIGYFNTRRNQRVFNQVKEETLELPAGHVARIQKDRRTKRLIISICDTKANSMSFIVDAWRVQNDKNYEISCALSRFNIQFWTEEEHRECLKRLEAVYAFPHPQ